MNKKLDSHVQDTCSTAIERPWVHICTGLPRNLPEHSAANWSPTGKGKILIISSTITDFIDNKNHFKVIF